MKLTAMQSIKDQKFFVRDVIAGVLGSILYYSMIGTVYSFQVNMIQPIDVGLLLVSRVIADAIYHYFVSETKKFSETNEEKLATLAVMVAILYQQKQLNIPIKVITYFIAQCVVSTTLKI